MGIGNIIGGVASIGGSLLGARSASKAADSQASAAAAAAALQKEMFETTREDLAPFRSTGLNAQNALAYELGVGLKPILKTPGGNAFGYKGFEATPGYQFQMDQGTQAIDRSAAARGGLFSGATMKASQRFGQGLAAQEYGNYLSRLGNFAGNGQNAAAQTGALGAQSVNNQGNALMQAGAARASGYAGVNNAIQSGIEGVSFFGRRAAG